MPDKKKPNKNLTQEFFVKLKTICASIGVKPEDLITIMSMESDLDPAAHNKNGNAVGLIQFMPPTLKGVGYTGDYQDFQKLDAISQLDYVQRYYSAFKYHPKNYVELYIINFFARSIYNPGVQEGNPDAIIVASDSAKQDERNAYNANQVLDANKDGKITYGDLKQLLDGVRSRSSYKQAISALNSSGSEDKLGDLDSGDEDKVQKSENVEDLNKQVDFLISQFKALGYDQVLMNKIGDKHIPGWNESYNLLDEFPQLEGSASDRAATAAKILCEHSEIKGAHCWDWINKVYYYANCTTQRVFQDLDYEGPDCGNHKASMSLLSQIEPGDWLYVNNKNKLDDKGNHSVIVVEKLGATKIKAAAVLRSGSSGVMYDIDLIKQPVTYISKPVLKPDVERKPSQDSGDLNEQVESLLNQFKSLGIHSLSMIKLSHINKYDAISKKITASALELIKEWIKTKNSNLTMNDIELPLLDKKSNKAKMEIFINKIPSQSINVSANISFDDIVNIKITIDMSKKAKLSDFYEKLCGAIRHELKHFEQYLKNRQEPYIDPYEWLDSTKKYLTQRSEVEAYVAGAIMQAKIRKVNIGIIFDEILDKVFKSAVKLDLMNNREAKNEKAEVKAIWSKHLLDRHKKLLTS